MPAPLLELTRATVLKDGRPALDDVSLTIHEGEHTAILGPNGAGKSVLVGLLTHHERAVVHDDGTPAVRVLGEARWDVSTLRGQLGVVSSALHQRFVAGNSEGFMTGHSAVLSAFFASHGILRYGTVTAEMQARTETALTRVGASHLAGRLLHEMSGGEARRGLTGSDDFKSAPSISTFPTDSYFASALEDPSSRFKAVAKTAHEFFLTERQARTESPALRCIPRRAGDPAVAWFRRPPRRSSSQDCSQVE